MAEPDANSTAPNAPIHRSTKIVYGLLFGLMALLAISRLIPDSKPSHDSNVPSAVSKAASAPSGAGLDENTSCAVAVEAFDHGDTDAAVSVDRIIGTVMRRADQVHVHQDQSGIITRLRGDGFLKIRLAAVESCRQHPGATLFEAAQDMYEGVRDLQRSMDVR